LWFEKQLTNFTNWVGSILGWALNHKFITLSIVVVLFFSSFQLVSKKFISSEFMPQGDRGEFLVQIELPKDVSIEQTNQMTRIAEDYLASLPEVTSTIATVGQSSATVGLTLAPAYQAEITVKIVDKKQRDVESDIFATQVKKALEKKLVGAKVKAVPVNLLGMAQSAPVQMVVIGSDLDSVEHYATQVMERLRKIPGATQVKLSVESGNPEISVHVDRDKMAALGLNLQTVGATMQIAFNGNDDSKFRQGQYEYDINVRFDEYDRKNIDNVKNIQFVNNRGEIIRLAQFAEVKESADPSQLDRRDKNTSIRVESQAVGRSSSDIVDDLEHDIQDIVKQTGVSYIWGGDRENHAEGFASLAIALVISILMVYFIMVALYNSFVYPFVVLMSIPLCNIGALLALALTNNTL